MDVMSILAGFAEEAEAERNAGKKPHVPSDHDCPPEAGVDTQRILDLWSMDQDSWVKFLAQNKESLRNMAAEEEA